jgi:integrase
MADFFSKLFGRGEPKPRSDVAVDTRPRGAKRKRSGRRETPTELDWSKARYLPLPCREEVHVPLRDGRPTARSQPSFSGCTIHELRHTAASLMIDRDWPVVSVSKTLGHSSISVTVDRYGHMYRDTQEALVARFDDAREQR